MRRSAPPVALLAGLLTVMSSGALAQESDPYAPADGAPPAAPAPDAAPAPEAAGDDDEPAAEKTPEASAPGDEAAPAEPAPSAPSPSTDEPTPGVGYEEAPPIEEAPPPLPPVETEPAAPPAPPDADPESYALPDPDAPTTPPGGAGDPAAPPVDAPEQKPPEPAPWFGSLLGSGNEPRTTVGLGLGYTLRMHDDERTHGFGLTGFFDIPLWYGFGVQLQGYGHGWIPSEKAPNPLGLAGGAGSLMYAFDDTDAVAWVAAGPTVAAGIVIDDAGTTFQPHAGALLQFGVRFPLGEASKAEVAIRAPLYFYGPGGLNLTGPFVGGSGGSATDLFPTQIALTAGLNFEPVQFFDSMKDHGNAMRALLPAFLAGKGDKPATTPAQAPAAPAQDAAAPADGDSPPPAPVESDETK